MKQKGNNIKIFNSYWLRKGLFFLFLFSITLNNFAQNIFEKSITSKANKIVIELNVIDQIELITSEVENKIKVVSKSEENFANDIVIEENKDIVFIRSIGNLFEENELEVDKQCTIQPEFTSYQITIPKNLKVDVSYTQGNFYSNNFEGNLNLKVEEGIVNMNKFKGFIFVHINIGSVNFTELNNTKVSIESRLGEVTSSLLNKGITQTKNQIIGTFGEGISQLKINAIVASVHLGKRRTK